MLTTVQEFRSLILNLSDTDLSATHELPEIIFESLNFQYDCCELINFFENQLQLSAVSPTNRRYSRDLIVFAYSIYIKSASLYSDLVNFFFLPSIRTIRRYTQPINKSLKDSDSNYFFLEKQYQALKPCERLITLKIDEIQIKPKLEYRSGELTGFAANRDGEPAKHVQAFMIQSVMSKYSEMVQLIPVSRNDTSFLLESFKEVVVYLENIGFEILCVTSDNNGINRLMFQQLTNLNETHFLSGSNKKIFTLFDAPHMIKSFRNNFINSPEKIFKFPHLHDFFETSDIVADEFFDHDDTEYQSAKWQFLIDLYASEQNKLFKYGHNLTKAALFPDNIQRQQIPLALKILGEVLQLPSMSCLLKLAQQLIF